MAAGLPTAATLGLVLAATTAVPVDEIAQVLTRRQIDPPSAEVASGVTWAEFEPIVLHRDPYARYLSPAEYDGFRAGVGTRTGVGLHLSEAGAGWLVHPIPDGPAWRAGLRADARLLSVDGNGVNGHGRDWLAERIGGPEGDEVLLVVDMEHTGQQAIRVRRQPFTPPSISYVEEDGLAYLRLWDFRRRETLTALRRGIERLSSSNAPLIIDLRHASGGDLFEALDSTSLFLSAGLSLAMIEDNRGERREFRSLKGRITQRPVLLLVGPGTASAAESFALALHYHGAALLVGERTYGKCLTQTLAPLSNGGAIRFSNGRLLGPQGIPCDDAGMQPDVAVTNASQRSARALAAAGLRRLGLGVNDI